jgi:hypothetical protein
LMGARPESFDDNGRAVKTPTSMGKNYHRRDCASIRAARSCR